jgi:hypothetical protein
MTRQAQNLPRALATPRGTHAPSRAPAGWKHALKRRSVATAAASLLVVAVSAGAILGLAATGAGNQTPSDQQITRLLAGIPQHNHALGYPNAPVTLEVFADLKDPDSRTWWNNYLPAIVKQDVRTGRLQLRFHSYKTNTRGPVEFVDEQTAALAAGAQNKLWNYADIFYHQKRNVLEQSEFEPYATNSFLQSIARQTSGLNLARWQSDRHSGRREEQPSAESKTAASYELHVTPSFRIGRTGSPLTNYAGSAVIKYKAQHPISFITAQDINNAVKELDGAT